MAPGKRTKTSSFGSGGRQSHDSSAFYGGSLYRGCSFGDSSDFTENPIPPDSVNRIYIKSSENMEEIPESSVHLMVTSPPYNVGKDYDRDLTMSQYRDFLKRVFGEVFRVLVPGGRACINVANLGRKPYIPLHAHIIDDMLSLGFVMRGEIIWNKSASAGSSTAWGSWMSASNPALRDVHEYILIFCKGTFKRLPPEKRESTITKEDFLSWTKSIWDFKTESAKKVGHPAPFPVELPYRLIQLYTFAGETVLDPFCGSGSTWVAAEKSGRRFVGYEIDEGYAKKAISRVGVE